MSQVQSFPPIASKRSKLLIPGSMPGVASLKAGQYHAHPRNAFWYVMGELFGAGPSLPYQDRIARLQSVGVALWECAQGREAWTRRSRQKWPNEFHTFFRDHPNISHVFFNGGKAEAAFRRHVLPALSKDRPAFARLPSTGPAYADITLEVKVKAWSVVRKALEP